MRSKQARSLLYTTHLIQYIDTSIIRSSIPFPFHINRRVGSGRVEFQFRKTFVLTFEFWGFLSLPAREQENGQSNDAGGWTTHAPPWRRHSIPICCFCSFHNLGFPVHFSSNFCFHTWEPFLALLFYFFCFPILWTSKFSSVCSISVRKHLVLQ